MAPKKQAKGKSEELGFGQKAYSRTTRLISQNGEFNVEKQGLKFWDSLDLYHELISIKWWKFFSVLFFLFLGANVIFALLYFVSGVDGISGYTSQSILQDIITCFYFSTQAITTVGFGALSPTSDAVSFLAAIESFIGLLGFALATGLMFARFSRPGRSLIYSENAIIAPYKDINALMFRFSNKSKNQLIESEVDVVITYWSNKDKRRIFKPVDLERKKINFFSMSWTVVHPITEKSPIFEWSVEDFKEKQVEVIVMFKAFDDTYARQVYDRTSYIAEEITWGESFSPIYNTLEKGKIHIDMEKLSETEPAKLN
ncbi:ion channel [Roseivirga sp.]|uniref:ion channel n=1 Tax=Roseivirga sp. TaxID=1964215 RepID=UPI003B8D9523